jgi:hypothetical protein
MRIFFILIATAAAVGGLVFTLKVPNIKGSERVLANYRANPLNTMKKIETAIFECIPDTAKSAVGVKFTRELIAPLYIKIVDLRLQGVPKETASAQIQKWIVTNHPKLLTELPDKDFLELSGYLKTIGNDDVENCIISSAALKDGVDIKADEWDLRG